MRCGWRRLVWSAFCRRMERHGRTQVGKGSGWRAAGASNHVAGLLIRVTGRRAISFAAYLRSRRNHDRNNSQCCILPRGSRAGSWRMGPDRPSHLPCIQRRVHHCKRSFDTHTAHYPEHRNRAKRILQDHGSFSEVFPARRFTGRHRLRGGNRQAY